MDKKNEFMRRAIELSEESVSKGGGPFGAFRLWEERADKTEY